jgi:hypothetical protein
MHFLRKIRQLPRYCKILWVTIIFTFVTMVHLIISSFSDNNTFMEVLKLEMKNASIAYLIAIITVLFDDFRKSNQNDEK